MIAVWILQNILAVALLEIYEPEQYIEKLLYEYWYIVLPLLAIFLFLVIRWRIRKIESGD
ncbi:MAG: hypothetical protein KatS3mg031_2715 [Chitinophagales bacterium]|nr:MAG: hypothetical protein KatS3mg031_2715 [Chitinophagales bacterium]